MNQYEYYRDIQLSGGTLLAVSVTGETDALITTPGSQKEFFEQVQLDEQGRLKIYIRDYISPTPTPTLSPTPTPTPTPSITPTPTPVYYYYNIEPCSGGTGAYNKIRSLVPLTIGISVTLASLPTCYEVVSVGDSSGIGIGNFSTYSNCADCLGITQTP